MLAELKEVKLKEKHKISKKGYEEFRRNFERMVFDKDGNYLYTKVAEEDKFVTDFRGAMSNEIEDTASLIKNIRKRNTELKPQ